MYSLVSKPTKKAVVTTTKRFWQQSINSNNKPGFGGAVKKDIGVLPLVFANGFAGALVLIFAGRKILYHPDVMISDGMRRPGIHNETLDREDCSNQYKDQTRLFANTLAPLAAPIVKTLTGSDSDVWKLEFTRNNNTEIDIPLEHTAFFDDGLFRDVTPGPLESSKKARTASL